MDLPKKGVYRHFKGKRYELLDFARHSETQELMAVYRPLYGEGGLWVRPLEMWSEIVERDGMRQARFMPEEEYLRLHGQNAPTEDGPMETDSGSAPRIEEKAPDKMQILKRVFGYDGFREGQEDVIDSILSGRDTLGILPTGAGKSICYQLPALMLSGVTLVISPLISLMQDQVNALIQAGVPAAYLNRSLTDRQFNSALERMQQGKYRIVYVAPERLLTPRFLACVRKLEISMVAIDEAHCISQWGQDFRPSYLDISEFIARLPQRPRLCAFTATATQKVKQDIVRLLEMRDPFVRVTGFNRPNLYLSVSYTHEKDRKLMELLDSYRGFSGIIYCGTRKSVEKICEKLLERGYMATRYHSGLSETERQHNQEDFIYDRSPIMVATNAFGMGIDKSNVRFVIHYNMPKDIESYYQEAGRAGRDGERADCHLLYEPRDTALQRFFIDKMGEENDLSPEVLQTVQMNAGLRLNAMVDYCRSSQCLRQKILRYFGENAQEKCQYCVNCLNPRDREEVSATAQIVIGCVRENNGRFGARMFIDVLRGEQNDRIRSARLDDSSYHGALKNVSVNNLRYIIDALIDEDALRIQAGDYPLLECGAKADEVTEGLRRIWAVQDEISPIAHQSASHIELEADIDPILFERLRQMRMRISKARSVPPYAVCNDTAIKEMCRIKPRSESEMRFVKGMGERKIQAFGGRFLKVIQDYLDESK